MSSATSTYSTRDDKMIISNNKPSSPQMSNYLNPSIKNEDQVIQEIAHRLETILKLDQDVQYSLPSLEALRKRNLSWHKIQEKSLFKTIHQLKDKAQLKKSMAVKDMAEDLLKHWRDLQQRSNNNMISPKPSPVSSPIQSYKNNNNGESIKLAIQKDPPQKPKAISNTTSFFASLDSNVPVTNTKRFSESRLVSSQQQEPFNLNNVLQKIKSPSSSNGITSTTELNRKRSYENNNYNNNNMMIKNNNDNETFSSSSSTMVHKKRKGNRRVTFKPDYCLVEVREYEKQPEEWNSDLHHASTIAEARDLEHKEAQVMSQVYHQQQYQQQPSPPSTPKNQQQQLDPRLTVSYHHHQEEQEQIIDHYYPPKLIKLPDDIQLPKPQSNEALIQIEREKVTIAAIYTSLSHIPPTPQDPDEVPDENNYTPIIPLESTDAITENEQPQQQQQQQQPMATLLQQPFIYQSPPISQSNLHSISTNNNNQQQHSFVSSSINYSNINQQNMSSPLQQPSTFLQTTTNPTFIQQQQQQQQPTFVHIPNQQLQQQQPQQQQIYYNYLQPLQQQQQQQPASMSDQLSQLLSNPDIVNQLKEAIQNSTNASTIHQTPEPQQTGSIPLNDYQEAKRLNSRPNKKRGKSKSKTVCRFYGKNPGCRSGNNCPFLHID